MYDRKNLKYIQEEDLYFSLLNGSGIYCWNEMEDKDPTDISGQRTCPVFMNVNTNEQFFVKRIYWDKYLDQYKKAIQIADKANNVIWPVDIVSLHGHQITANYTEHVFGLQTDEIKNHKYGDNIFLFPYKNYGISRTVKQELDEIKQISWKNDKVRELMINIVKAFQKLNNRKYLCLDFDFSHLYILDNKSIMFEYSNLIIHESDNDPDGNDRMELHKGEYPYEFAEPALVQGKIKHADADTQNYALAAMLFYLMCGCYPYDGPLLLGLTDTNEVEHEQRFNIYHKTPVFIFDPDDTSNHLGEFAADKKIIDLWNDLPEQIRFLFTKILGRDNAERTFSVSNPSPSEWLKCLQLL